MMKVLRATALSCVLAGSAPSGIADEEARLRMEQALGEFAEKKRASQLDALLKAREIVVCSPVGPDGFKIREVLRGGSKVGDYWNDGMFPNGPVLAYERWEPGAFDPESGAISMTGHFNIDREGRVVLWSDPLITMTLAELRQMLARKTE